MQDDIKISEELRNFWKQEEEANSFGARQNLMEQLHTKLAVNMAKKWEETVKDVFYRKTGDELTLENVNRIEIIKVLNDQNEYYHIDGKLAITLYPMDMTYPQFDNMYRITVGRNYQEHEW